MTDQGEATSTVDPIDTTRHDDETQHRQPSPDNASSTSQPPHPDEAGHDEDADTPEGDLDALLLDIRRCRPIALSSHHPLADIAEFIGDAHPRLIRPATDLGVWTGHTTVDVNKAATSFLRHLLHAVADGDYAASNDSREQARTQLSDPERRPVVSGRAVITGIDEAGQPAPALPEAFTTWALQLYENWHAALIDQLHDLGQQGITIVIHR